MNARLIPAAAAAVALAVAGCGGGGDPASQTLGGGASLVGSNAIAFVSIDTSASSAQWQTVNSLLGKFPAHEQWLTQLRQAFEQKTKLSWANDVAPALGPELDVAVMPGQTPQVVALTQPADAAKLAALTAKAGLVTRTVGGWTAIAKNASAFTGVGATPSLAQDNTYVEATGKLAADALATAYANGTEAQQLIRTLHPTTTQPDVQLQWAAADLVAQGDGMKAQAFARATPASPSAPAPTAPYSASLPDEIPAGALAVADFQVPAGGLTVHSTSTLPKPLQALLAKHPNLVSELGQILGGETAIWVSPGMPIPAVTLATNPPDTTAAVNALPDALAALREAIAAAAGTKLPLDLSQIPIYHAVQGGQLVLSTSQQAIADFRSGSGPRLSADGTFKEATQASGMPAQTTGFAYVNVKDALPLAQTLGSAAGVTVPAGLDPLRTLTVYGGRAGDTESVTLFLEVK